MDINDLISHVLRIGVVVSLMLTFLGVIFLFVSGGSNGSTLDQISSANTAINSSMFSYSSVISGLSTYQGLDFIALGLILLVATPVIRVFLSILAFLYEKNWLYFVITLIVFADLMVAVFIVPALLMR